MLIVTNIDTQYIQGRRIQLWNSLALVHLLSYVLIRYIWTRKATTRHFFPFTYAWRLAHAPFKDIQQEATNRWPLLELFSPTVTQKHRCVVYTIHYLLTLGFLLKLRDEDHIPYKWIGGEHYQICMTWTDWLQSMISEFQLNDSSSTPVLYFAKVK